MADRTTSSSSNSEDDVEPGELKLSCSSSSFEGSEREEEEDDLDEMGDNIGLQPYQYEPVMEVTLNLELTLGLPAADVNGVPLGLRLDGQRERLEVEQWCTCQHCTVMETANECRCCRETPETLAKIERLVGEPVQCITEHPGFAGVCLDVYVQEAAYYDYRQKYGHYGQDQDIHKRFRYIAYRQLVRWCWKYLGKENRVVLPACAVSKIRDRFPSAEYVGFHYPNIDLL